MQKKKSQHVQKTTQKTQKVTKKRSVSTRKGSLIKDVFVGAGFTYIESEGKHISVSKQDGEIDYIFMWENVIVLCEETSGKDVSNHFAKKLIYHELIYKNKKEFFTEYEKIDVSIFNNMKEYNYEDLEVRCLYYSAAKEVSQGTARNSAILKVITQEQAQYFAELSKTVGKTSRFELLKFLGISLGSIGQARISGVGVPSYFLPALALSSKRTNYPDDFICVSLYIDPNMLLSRSCVFRRDGWQDPNLSYQRFIDKKKLAEIRKYLANDGRVFVNNVIVTFPPGVIIKNNKGELLKREDIDSNKLIEVELKDEISTIGIIDGQHRVFAYYEGNDDLESKISQLRQRQNLLVTGIIFPENYDEEQRVRFEADLFLSINSNQKPVEPSLKQEIELIIHPEMPLAVARAIIKKLAVQGALAGMLQTSQFSSPSKIATASIASFVLAPMVRKGGKLYNSWDSTDKKSLENESHREEYINYCATGINSFLGIIASVLELKWKIQKSGGVLNTNVVAAFIHLYGTSLKSDKVFNKKTLEFLNNFTFTGYGSSKWAALSNDIFSHIP